MIEEGGLDPAAGLLAALDEAARLLEDGDSEGAARAISSLAGRCAALSQQGLSPESVAIARGLLERCRAAEAKLRRHVTDEMSKLGNSRRAQAAYER
jgi:hypothetical protein